MSIVKTPYKEGGNQSTGEKVRISWTSDGSGDFTDSVILKGWLVKMVTDPDATAAPTADYDITLIDDRGGDVLGGAGADRSATTVQYIPTPNASPLAVTYLNGSYTFTVANAGASKAGVCDLYLVYSS